jgi:hypothetical protein
VRYVYIPQRRAARQHDAQAPAEHRVHLLEDELSAGADAMRCADADAERESGGGETLITAVLEKHNQENISDTAVIDQNDVLCFGGD